MKTRFLLGALLAALSLLGVFATGCGDGGTGNDAGATGDAGNHDAGGTNDAGHADGG